MCQTPLCTNKHNTNTTQHVLDTTIYKQTPHNMCQTPLCTSKQNTTCVRHHYTQTNKAQHVLDTTIYKQTKYKHNTTCVRHHYAQTNTTQHVLDTTQHKQTKHNMCQAPLVSMVDLPHFDHIYDDLYKYDMIQYTFICHTW